MALIGCKDGGFIFGGKSEKQQNGGGREEGAVHQCGQVDGCLLSTLLGLLCLCLRAACGSDKDQE